MITEKGKSFMVVYVRNSVIKLFPETNHVGDKIFQIKILNNFRKSF